MATLGMSFVIFGRLIGTISAHLAEEGKSNKSIQAAKVTDGHKTSKKVLNVARVSQK